MTSSNSDKHNVLALKNKKVIDITEVNTGDDECVCLECGEPIIPHKGFVKAHHFQHKSGSYCSGNMNGGGGGYLETLFHFGLKKAIEQLAHLPLPKPLTNEAINLLGLNGFVDNNKLKLINPKAEFRIKGDSDEYRVADVSANAGICELAIEIMYTHKTSDQKIHFLKEKNIDVFEIKINRHHLPEISALSDNIRDKAWEKIFQCFTQYCEIKLPDRWKTISSLVKDKNRAEELTYELNNMKAENRDKQRQLSNYQQEIVTLKEDNNSCIQCNNDLRFQLAEKETPYHARILVLEEELMNNDQIRIEFNQVQGRYSLAQRRYDFTDSDIEEYESKLEMNR